MPEKVFQTNEVTTRTNKPLGLIHVDVCGLMHSNSFDKNKYFLLFIDDFKRKKCVYFLKEKSKVFGNFSKSKALIEKKSDYNMKAIVRSIEKANSHQNNLNNIMTIIIFFGL